MSQRSEPRGGWFSAATGAAAVIVLAPFAFVVRVWQRRRRGPDTRVQRRTDDRGDGAAVIDLRIDVPASSAGDLRARLTDVVIRVAETLRAPGDVYHEVHRPLGVDETIILPVGPLLQELGERLSLSLGHAPLAGRTVVWLTLPRGLAPAELVDPFDYDPEAEGEPHAVMEHSDVRWGFATSHALTGPSVIYRVLLFVPAAAVQRVESLVLRLQN